MTKRIIVALLFALPRPALAQDVPPEVQLTPATEEPDPLANLIDFRNVAISAAKEAVTIQEAPAIVTVITADDLSQWGYRSLEDALSDVPGWNHFPAEGETERLVTTRGQPLSMLLLHDGISLFDPMGNELGIKRQMPLEAIKRVEVVTGPGGVLWGANSFLGIVNIITKDAGDVNGVEAGASYGDGRGNLSDARAYAMTGHSLLDGRLKLFTHASYENYVGQQLDARQLIAHSPAPQPNGPVLFGTQVTSDTPPSWIASFDGKLSMGPLSLYWMWTSGDMHWPAGWPLGIVQQSVPAGTPFGPNQMSDPNRVGRDFVLNEYYRYAALQYHDRFAGGRVGVDTKIYAVQIVEDLAHFMFFPPSALLQGGAGFSTDPSSQRAGAAVDTEISLPASNHLLLGGDAFREWADHTMMNFYSPDPSQPNGGSIHSQLPIACPHNMAGSYLPTCPVTFLFPASRDVLAVYASDRWRPTSKLTFEGGARLQAAYGERPYDPVLLFSGAAVWQLAPKWHLKANLAQGFRPPVFNNTDSNGAAVELAGNQNIKSEHSQALQGELNARVLQGQGNIRDLTMRADYSYTTVDNLITIDNGRYINTGKRGIHSAELLSRAELRGGHSLQFGYTYLQIADDIKGIITSIPAHWFTVNARINLIRDRLDAVSALSLGSATQDPNRVPHPNLATCLPGTMPSPQTCGADAMTSNIAFDRLPAPALWNLGLAWKPADRFQVSGFVYNVLDQHWYYPDAFYDLSPQLEMQPYPGEGRSFMARASYRY